MVESATKVMVDTAPGLAVPRKDEREEREVSRVGGDESVGIEMRERARVREGEGEGLKIDDGGVEFEQRGGSLYVDPVQVEVGEIPGDGNHGGDGEASELEAERERDANEGRTAGSHDVGEIVELAEGGHVTGGNVAVEFSVDEVESRELAAGDRWTGLRRAEREVNGWPFDDEMA